MLDMAPMHASAVISECGRYRYHLWRLWHNGKPPAVFIMLNPSTADAQQDDPTIRKCIGFARRWGCGSIEVVNLFALRATDPRELRRSGVADPVGPKGRDWIERVVEWADDESPIIAAWGVHGHLMAQDETTFGWIEYRKPKCLGRTKGGFPRHPLMTAYATALEPYTGRAAQHVSPHHPVS